MKKLTFLLLFGATLFSAKAQIPQSISYQAVARDSTGTCITNQAITVRMSIIDDAVGTAPIFQELFTNVQTNSSGHFQLAIGTGTLQGGSPGLSELNWHISSQTRHLKVELSPNNDNNLQEVGMTQLLSVPYAIAADNGKKTSVTNNDEFIRFKGENGNENTSIGGLPDANGDYNLGVIRVMDDGGDPVLTMYSSPGTNGSGRIEMFGENGNRNASIRGLTDTNGEYNLGIITVHDDQGASAINLRSQIDWGGAGRLVSYGPNTTRNVEVSIQTSDNVTGQNRGAIRIRDENDVQKVYLGTDGNGAGFISADGANGGVKNFVMDHPKQAGMQIAYASLEGPEAGAYTRGTTKLVNGEAIIQFSEHFQIVANPTTMTILTSPLSADSKGLAIVEKTATGFKVKEMWKGTGNYEFDWEVKAVRKGWEDYKVVRQKPEEPTLDRTPKE